MNSRVVEDIATAYAHELLSKYGLDGWLVVWHDEGNLAGRCSFDSKVITLNRSILLNTAAQNIVETIRHEIAHALTGPGHEHDSVWSSILDSMGGTRTWVFNDGRVSIQNYTKE